MFGHESITYFQVLKCGVRNTRKELEEKANATYDR